MPLAFIRPMGESGLYHIHVVSATDPGFGVGGGGVDPGWGAGRPGGRPGQGLPGSGGIPDHDLPDTPPPVLAPGYTIVMVRSAHGKWEYAFIAPGDPPPRPLPGPPPHPGTGLPGQPVIGGGPANPPPTHPGGGPMPGNPPHPSGQPVPPMPTPTR